MEFEVLKKPFYRRFPTKTFLIMKLTCVLILFTCLQVSAKGYGQKVSLSVKNAPLEQVFNLVEKQTGYNFYYKVELLKLAANVDVKVKNASLDEALKIIFKNQPLTYNIVENNIVITEKEISKEEVVVVAPVPPAIVKGIVTDENGKPIPGASVLVKGTKIATSTNENGEFSFVNIDDNSTLVFSNIGYESSEIKLRGRTVVAVSLKIRVQEGEEVIISTGIFKKSDKSFTGASTTVTAKELQQFGNRNLITSLRNIEPSFNIIESNNFGSDPNRLPEIQIRGNSSIPNVGDLKNDARVGLNTPLIILDGFQSTLQKLLDINENEVETITILKDASATAMYGSRGSNGVVVITTKAPKLGKLKVTLRSDINIELPDLTDYNLLKAKDKLELERIAGYFNNARAETDLQLKRYYNYLLDEVNRGVETDWTAIPLRTGIGQRHNIRLEGGDNAFRYSASAQVNNIEGVMKGSNRNTFNGGITLSYIYKKVRFKNNLQISQGKSKISPYGEFSDYARLNPYWRPYDENGNILKKLGDPGNYDYNSYTTTLPGNPLYNASLGGFNKSATNEIINNTSVEFNVTRGLIARLQLGLTKGTIQSDVFRTADNTAFANYSDSNVFRKGDYKYGISNYFRYDASANLSYSKRFANDHLIFAGMDLNVRESNASSYGFLAEGFSNPRFDFISTALQYAEGGKPTGTEEKSRAIGYTTNVNYSFANRYFVDGSLRIDGSSQFGSNKRFAPFWSVGAGWNLHEEKFLKDNKVVNRLKLRGSTGITGSQNFSSYQSLATYRYYTDDRYFSWLGSYLLGLGNEDLQWQQASKYDVGVDAEFLNRRLKLTADYYIETTKDLISSINLPASNGFTSYIENIGSMRNKGYEVKITGILINNIAKRFSWSVTAAAVHNKNYIINTSKALKDAQESIKNSTSSIGTLYYEGFSSNAIWVVPSLGIDPSTGKELYLGADGLPTYTWNGAAVKAVGTTEPTLFGNFSTMVRFRNFTLNTSFGYRFGGQQYNQTLVNKVESGNYKYNVDARVYTDRWKIPGDISAFKGLLVTGATYKTSRFVQDENTLRCQNINLQYALNANPFLQNFGVSALNLSANFSDVFYLSTVRRERGISYPFSKQFSFSVNATF